MWALNGTDPDKNIFMTRQDILDKIIGTLPWAKQFVRGHIDHHLEALSDKGNLSGREIRWHRKDDKFCLPYETRQVVQNENAADESLRIDVSNEIVASASEICSLADAKIVARVCLSGFELAVKRHPQFGAAKAGAISAAESLVTDLANPDRVQAIKALPDGKQAELVSVHALETEGVNEIPAALAKLLSASLGLASNRSIVQSNTVGHTGASGYHRHATGLSGRIRGSPRTIRNSAEPVGPPSPILATGATFTPRGDTLFYNSGDLLEVILEDTAHGLRITIHDLTSGESGSMTASAKNGFAQVRFDPNGTECDAATHNIPADFHPIYLTSNEHTRVPWAAHSYNIAFSDEIGHFEFCNGVNVNGVCIDDGVHDRDNGLPTGAEDDQGCTDANTAGALGLIAIGGCTATDFDFDGVPYLRVWPGTLHDTKLDSALHPQAVEFTSPVFRDPDGDTRNYSRVAFETDLGRIESNTNPHVSDISPILRIPNPVRIA